MISRRVTLAAGPLCVIAGRAFAAPAQVVLVDGTFKYVDDGFEGDRPPATSFASWTRGGDLRHGELRVRVDVRAKPNDRTPTELHVRLASGSHKDRAQVISLGHRVIRFATKGVHRFALPVQSATPLLGGPLAKSAFRWDAPPTFVQVAVADAAGHRVSRWEQDLGAFRGERRDYLPLEAKLTAIVVPAGATFVPPVGW